MTALQTTDTLIRPSTRGFDFLTVGKPRAKVELEDFAVRINGFVYFEISGFAVLQATFDDDGIGFFVEEVEIVAPCHRLGEPATRVLNATDADTADEARLWSIIKEAIEADEGFHEAIRSEFGGVA